MFAYLFRITILLILPIHTYSNVHGIVQFLPSSVSSVTIRIVKKAENKAEIRPRKRETLNKFYERFLSIVRLQTFFSLSSYNFFINSALIHFNDFQRRMWFFYSNL